MPPPPSEPAECARMLERHQALPDTPSAWLIEFDMVVCGTTQCGSCSAAG